MLRLVLVLALMPAAVMATPADSVDFRVDDHHWEHRLLFVFAPSDTSDALAQQESAIEGHDPGFQDRDLLLLTVAGSGQGTHRSVPGAESQPLTKASVRRLRERFDVPADSFRVILVGKDGTEKRRDAEPVTARSILDTIDAMPMRQREMRESSGG
ncbi:MAG: DUF4174 domain-containing protein [Salinibacter sp.]